MEIPQAAWRTVVRMHERFAATLPPTEDGAREFTRMTIAQLKHEDPRGGWCWKSSSPSSPPSKDCVARVTDEGFHGWDVLSGAGSTGPRNLSGFPPLFHSLSGQNPIPVAPWDHLGTGAGTGGGGSTGGGGNSGGGGGGEIPADDALQAIANGIEDIGAALTVMANIATALEQRGIAITITIAPKG